MPGILRAGTLNRRVRLQKVTMTSDSEGVSSEAWSDVATIWAHIAPAGGTETFVAAQTQEKITHQVTIRYRSDVTPKMRFLYTFPVGMPPRNFFIHAMFDPDENNVELDCLCEEFITTQVGAT